MYIHFFIFNNFNINKACFRLLFFYEAVECLVDLLGNALGEVFHREVLVEVGGLEVEAQVAVAAAGDGDKLAVEHLRGFLALGGTVSLGEGEVVLAVATQHAGIVLSYFGHTVVGETGLDVDAEVGVYFLCHKPRIVREHGEH